MLFITLLNKTEKFKSFVFKKAHIEQVDGEEAIGTYWDILGSDLKIAILTLLCPSGSRSWGPLL